MGRGAETALALVLVLGAVPPGGAEPVPRVGPDGVWEAPAPVPGGRYLRVLHTNDVHGHCLPRAYAGENLPGEWLGRPIGGLFSVATYVARVRARARRVDPEATRRFLAGDDGVLLLDGGDWFGGTLFDAATEGRVTGRIFAHPALDFDATCMGNHAWDYHQRGLEGFVAALGGRLPILTVNYEHMGKTPGWCRPSTVVEVEGVRVGLLGAVTPSAVLAALPEKTAGVTVVDPLPAIAAEARRLRPRVDLVILLAHFGLERDTALAARLAALDDRDPAANVDLVIDGHSHRETSFGLDDDTWVVQADHFATRLGEVLVEVGADRRPTGRRFARSLVLDAEALPPPRGLTREFADELLARERLEEEAVAAAEPGFRIPARPRHQPVLANPAGDLLARSFYEACRLVDPEVAAGAMNQGGVRTGLYGTGSKITRAAVHAMAPFGNTLSIIELEGAALTRLVTRGIEQAFALSFAGLEVSARDRPAGERPAGPVDPHHPPGPSRELTGLRLIRPDGTREPIDPRRRYKLAVSQYLAGRGFDGEAGVVRRDLPLTDAEALVALLQRLNLDGGPLTAARMERLLGPPVRLAPAGGAD